MHSDKPISIEYEFKFSGAREDKKYTVLLDRKTLQSIPSRLENTPDWIALDFCQCSICPLKKETHPYCPIAYNIANLANEFLSIYSIEQCEIHVTVHERTYLKKDSIQQGLRSLLGIYLATSGCPHMDILKPMARFHLPFASMEETIYRHTSTYLLGQYFEYLDGKHPDYELKGLLKVSENMDKVNKGICDRINQITEADSNKNALIILNAIGLMLGIEVQGKLDSLKYLFQNIRYDELLE